LEVQQEVREDMGEEEVAVAKEEMVEEVEGDMVEGDMADREGTEVGDKEEKKEEELVVVEKAGVQEEGLVVEVDLEGKLGVEGMVADLED
tara:strand:+ start:333 stop:602 length:270 start_codon:yes stop_codon:yes gene_type:complete